MGYYDFLMKNFSSFAMICFIKIESKNSLLKVAMKKKYISAKQL